PPRCTLFPYTTLFRSQQGRHDAFELVAVIAQDADGVLVALVHDAPRLLVHDGEHGGRGLRLLPVAGQDGERADLLRHAPAAHHAPGDHGDLFEVALGAGGDDAVDDVLGRHAAERPGDAAAQVALVVGVAVGLGCGEGDAERP